VQLPFSFSHHFLLFCFAFFSGNACFRIFRAENASLSAPVMKSGAGGATVSLSITRAQDCQIFLG
jgi:hypothetical protein